MGKQIYDVYKMIKKATKGSLHFMLGNIIGLGIRLSRKYLFGSKKKLRKH
jgi:hypothetical protein